MKKFYFLFFCFSFCQASILSDPESLQDHPPLQILKGDETQPQKSETDRKIMSWMGREELNVIFLHTNKEYLSSLISEELKFFNTRIQDNILFLMSTILLRTSGAHVHDVVKKLINFFKKYEWYKPIECMMNINFFLGISDHVSKDRKIRTSTDDPAFSVSVQRKSNNSCPSASDELRMPTFVPVPENVSLTLRVKIPTPPPMDKDSFFAVQEKNSILSPATPSITDSLKKTTNGKRPSSDVDEYSRMLYLVSPKEEGSNGNRVTLSHSPHAKDYASLTFNIYMDIIEIACNINSQYFESVMNLIHDFESLLKKENNQIIHFSDYPLLLTEFNTFLQKCKSVTILKKTKALFLHFVKPFLKEKPFCIEKGIKCLSVIFKLKCIDLEMKEIDDAVAYINADAFRRTKVRYTQFSHTLWDIIFLYGIVDVSFHKDLSDYFEQLDDRDFFSCIRDSINIFYKNPRFDISAYFSFNFYEKMSLLDFIKKYPDLKGLTPRHTPKKINQIEYIKLRMNEDVKTFFMQLGLYDLPIWECYHDCQKSNSIEHVLTLPKYQKITGIADHFDRKYSCHPAIFLQIMIFQKKAYDMIVHNIVNDYREYSRDARRNFNYKLNFFKMRIINGFLEGHEKIKQFPFIKKKLIKFLEEV